MTAVGLRTLRARVTLLAAAAVVVVLALAGVGLVSATRRTLIEDLDEALAAQARVVAAQVAAGREVTSADLLSDDVVVEVVGRDGRVLTRVPEGASALPDADTEGTRVLTRETDGASVRVGGSLEDVSDSTGALIAALALIVPLATLALAAVVWWAVGRALRPVEHMRREVEAIGGSDLSRRVDEPPVPEEIGRLARTMNAMLARLQFAGERQRRFVDDASHELRGPLARIRAELEVDRAHPGSADPARTATTLLAEAQTMQHLVDDLLLLARGNSHATADRSRPVDLDRLVEKETARRRAAGASIDTTGVRPVQVRGNGPELARAVGNLLDNAVRHAVSHTVVALAEQPDGTAVLAVADDGSGIPEADRERVFERFVRLDAARPAGDGVGLGLAIARDVAERHGGTLAVAPSTTGARFLLTLPVLPPTG
jgi:signal transduction histidine kinase